MKVFSVFGVSQSGKTTTIEQIIKELTRRGYRVGSVKNIHFEDFYLDNPGSNTWRHRQAGSEMVVARGFGETDILIPRRLGIDSILRFFDHDYVVLEGVSDSIVPKILCAAQEEEITERMNDLVLTICGCISNNTSEFEGLPVINALTDVEKLVDMIEKKVNHKLPFIYGKRDCQICGSSCMDLAVKTIQGKAKHEDCVFLKNNIAVTIGGKELTLKPSVRCKILHDIEEVLSTEGPLSKDEISIRVWK